MFNFVVIINFAQFFSKRSAYSVALDVLLLNARVLINVNCETATVCKFCVLRSLYQTFVIVNLLIFLYYIELCSCCTDHLLQ